MWQRIPAGENEEKSAIFEMRLAPDGVFWAADNGNERDLRALLAAKAVATNVGNGDLTPLEAAQNNNHTECARLLEAYINRPVKSAGKINNAPAASAAAAADGAGACHEEGGFK